MICYHQECNYNHMGWKEEKCVGTMISEGIAMACYSHVELMDNTCSLEYG